MSERPSRPRRLARFIPPDAEARVLERRLSMLFALLGLAAATGVSARTCARIVARGAAEARWRRPRDRRDVPVRGGG